MSKSELFVNFNQLGKPPFEVRIYSNLMTGWGLVLIIFTYLAVLSSGKLSPLPAAYGAFVIILCLQSGIALTHLKPSASRKAVIAFALSSLMPIYVIWSLFVTRHIHESNRLQQSLLPLIISVIIMALLTFLLAWGLKRPLPRKWFGD